MSDVIAGRCRDNLVAKRKGGLADCHKACEEGSGTKPQLRPKGHKTAVNRHNDPKVPPTLQGEAQQHPPGCSQLTKTTLDADPCHSGHCSSATQPAAPGLQQCRPAFGHWASTHTEHASEGVGGNWPHSCTRMCPGAAQLQFKRHPAVHTVPHVIGCAGALPVSMHQIGRQQQRQGHRKAYANNTHTCLYKVQ